MGMSRINDGGAFVRVKDSLAVLYTGYGRSWAYDRTPFLVETP